MPVKRILIAMLLATAALVATKLGFIWLWWSLGAVVAIVVVAFVIQRFAPVRGVTQGLWARLSSKLLVGALVLGGILAMVFAAIGWEWTANYLRHALLYLLVAVGLLVFAIKVALKDLCKVPILFFAPAATVVFLIGLFFSNPARPPKSESLAVLYRPEIQTEVVDGPNVLRVCQAKVPPRRDGWPVWVMKVTRADAEQGHWVQVGPVTGWTDIGYGVTGSRGKVGKYVKELESCWKHNPGALLCWVGTGFPIGHRYSRIIRISPFMEYNEESFMPGTEGAPFPVDVGWFDFTGLDTLEVCAIVNNTRDGYNRAANRGFYEFVVTLLKEPPDQPTTTGSSMTSQTASAAGGCPSTQ